MPFDPHLVRPDVAPLHDSGELELPDDLLELAAQLGDDANHLAALYPAASKVGQASNLSMSAVDSPSYSAENSNSKSSSRGRAGSLSYVLKTTALVASIAILLISATLWYPRENATQAPPRSIASGPDHTLETNDLDTSFTPTPSLPPQSAISNPQFPISPPISLPTAPPPAASPAMFLHEYSGPELEGLYDLLGDSEDDKISI